MIPAVAFGRKLQMLRVNSILWRALFVFPAVTGAGCGTLPPEVHGVPMPNELRLNEVVSNNAGVWVDQLGETDDYIEIVNPTATPRDLSQYSLADSTNTAKLPGITLEPNSRVILWADGQTEQGQNHLTIRINSGGEELSLRRKDGAVVDRVEVPALAEHHAYARIPDTTGSFIDCGWATPTQSNGDTCGPPSVPDLPQTMSFLPFEWPSPWPAPPLPLRLTELALRPAAFIEVLNGSSEPFDLSQCQFTLAATSVGRGFPSAADGIALPLPPMTLGPHERTAVELPSSALADVAATTNFEGVVTLWDRSTGSVLDRRAFSQYPENAVLSRVPDPDGPFRYCANATPGASNDACEPVTSRDVGDHVRDLETPGDFIALSSSHGTVGNAAVEFIVDMESNDQVTLLNSANWDLHFIFIREIIEGQAHLNRCIPEELALFDADWYRFSVEQYFTDTGRRYLLGNLIKYAGSNIQTVEFSPGDAMNPSQMKRAFFAVLQHVDDPSKWALRPQDSTQLARMREIEGQVPIVDPNAPFRDITFQPLVPTVGFGTLRFIPSEAIREAELGPRDIVVTDQVPLDIPFIGGLITEAFQTPLAHVNVLSRGRGTPNMGLKGAREDPALKPLFGKLVRLEVGSSKFTISPANSAEAAAFWDSKKPSGPAAVPRLDTSVRGIQPLSAHGISDIPAIGGKAAQLAELGRVELGYARVPRNSFAIPVAHSLEHFEKSGGKARLSRYRQDPAFKADPTIREAKLALVRKDILAMPLDPVLLRALREQMATNWPSRRVRFRSSSNTEDLPNFNGAGLYISEGIKPSASDEEVATTLRNVWASLWRLRAYDEREYFNIDHDAVAMAVLVQEAFPSEAANGVAISRDILDPTRSELYYINAQVGEALVTNPAPGAASDEFTYSLWRSPSVVMHKRSSLTYGEPVLSDDEALQVASSLQAIHDHFRALIDPNKENPWFAMDIEFKFLNPNRELVIKQARPYSFGNEAPPGWCDLF